MEYLAIEPIQLVRYTSNFLINKVIALISDTDLPVVIGLSGGKSPHALYHQFAQSILANNRTIIERLVFIQIDERIADPSHEDSNQRMIYETLSPLFDKGATFHPMPTDSHDASICTEYEILLTSLLHENGYPGIAILGVGEDGHTASIFPDQLDLIPQDDRLVFMTPREKNGYFRISLSYTAIAKFKSILLYAPGTNKHKILQEIRKQKSYFIYPAAKVIHTNKDSYIVTSK